MKSKKPARKSAQRASPDVRMPRVGEVWNFKVYDGRIITDLITKVNRQRIYYKILKGLDRCLPVGEQGWTSVPGARQNIIDGDYELDKSSIVLSDLEELLK